MSGLSARVVLTCFALMILFLSVPVLAQDEEQEEGEEATEGVIPYGEEVTVTARKREETIQSVPFSIVAPTEELLPPLDGYSGL